MNQVGNQQPFNYTSWVSCCPCSPRTSSTLPGPRLDQLQPLHSDLDQHDRQLYDACYLICPSEVNPQQNGSPGFGVSNYGWCVGDWYVFGGVSAQPNRSAFCVNLSRGLSAFTDGLSNTVVAAEVKAYQPIFKSCFANGSGGTIAGLNNPNAVPAPSASAQVVINAAGAGCKVDIAHVKWSIGGACFDGFTTALPPNTKALAGSPQQDYDLDTIDENNGGPTYAPRTSLGYRLVRAELPLRRRLGPVSQVAKRSTAPFKCADLVPISGPGRPLRRPVLTLRDADLETLVCSSPSRSSPSGAWPLMTRPAPPRREGPDRPGPGVGDAADDPAIWIHPDDPARSLVLGTDKKGGLHAYTLDGRPKQLISPDSRPNNVDLLYGVRLGPDGRTVDLAVASVSGKSGDGLKFWTIDPKSGGLAELGAIVPTFDGGRPYGLCTYRSPRDGSAYAFVTDRDGRVEQYRPTPPGDGRSGGIASARLKVGSQAEGCVADRERGRLYIGEEKVGIWEYGAEPDAGDARTAVARVGEHGLAADIEGLAIYYAPGGKGYLIASSQGSNTHQVFERDGAHAHVLTIDPRAGSIDDVAETDGLDVTNERTSAAFPRGLLVVQDGKNEGRQNPAPSPGDAIAGASASSPTTPGSSNRRPTAAASSPRRPRKAGSPASGRCSCPTGCTASIRSDAGIHDVSAQPSGRGRE